MRTSTDQIAIETNNCSFSLQSLEKFLDMMAIQQTEYSDISYKANGSFALVLKAKKNGIEEVTLKVLECSNGTECQIKAMEREYAICKQLPSSDYFVAVQDQFYLIEMNDSAEQGQIRNSNTTRKVYFVQQMKMCLESLHDAIQQYQQQNKDPPTEEFKELLAIQMLDAVNLLHQRQIAHGNITTQNFLFSPSLEYPFLLKLCNFRFISSANLRNPVNSDQGNESLNCMPPIAGIQKDCLEQDLVFLGRVLLQLDNIGQKGDYSRISNSDLTQPKVITTFQTNQSTLLYKIACSLMNNSRDNIQTARSMLLLLLQKQTSTLKIPLFSVVLKNQVDSLRLQVPSKRRILDYLVWQVRKECKLRNIESWFNNKGQRETCLTVDLLKSALEIMLEWKEFSGQYNVLGVGVGGAIFGVDNLKKERKSALRLSLCINKAETIREIGIMRMCKAPYIVKFYWHQFFKDADGNEFVVYELERCKYSLTHHLELQRINGEYSDEQKHLLTLQIIDSVKFLHQNGILHRNIKIDSFLITENESGQTVVKLSNFSHAVHLQDSLLDMSIIEKQLCNREYQSPVNCILKRHNRESPLYFAPERWENPDLSTHLTDGFSVGLCIFLLDNYLVCSEEQLARKFFSVPHQSTKIGCNIDPLFSTKASFKNIANLLLMPQLQQRESLKNLDENFTSYNKEEKGISKDFNMNNLQQKTMFSIKNLQTLYEFKSASMRFESLQSISLNLNKKWIGDTETMSLLNLVCNLLNLSRFSIDIESNSILAIGTKSLLSPLSRLINLSSLSLSLFQNNIGNIEAQFLLSPLANLHNLSIIFLNLSGNKIGDIGAQSLLSPLVNLRNLSSITLYLKFNQIGEKGAQSLLSPLVNLLNLSSISLDLSWNQIGEKGAQFILYPLANLFNLSNIAIDLNGNQIGDKGAQSLLSPLVNLLNLSNLILDISWNQIGEKGAYSLLSPLENLLNLSTISLNLNLNLIGDIGVQSLLSPLTNILNLSSITLNLIQNQIGDIGLQFLLTPLVNLLNLQNISIDLSENQIGSIGVQSLLSPLANLFNLSSFTLNLNFNSIGDIGAQSLLSPLKNLLNLSSFSLDLSWNQIGEKGAQSLLSHLANLLNLSSIMLNLNGNQIGDKGAQYLLSPLENQHNLTMMFLNVVGNKIGEKGAQSLLAPLANLLNLSIITLNLNGNLIGDVGVQFLLFPLANLLNLSNIAIDLNENNIGSIGVQSLLSPLANLLNLSTISLELFNNQIKEKGAQSLLSPLANLFNLSSITLNLNGNQIGEKGAESLLYPLADLPNLSIFSLDVCANNIFDKGAYSLFQHLSNLINVQSLSLKLDNNSLIKKIKHLYRDYLKQVKFLNLKD